MHRNIYCCNSPHCTVCDVHLDTFTGCNWMWSKGFIVGPYCNRHKGNAERDLDNLQPCDKGEKYVLTDNV